ncbi:GNAT family N-acetyltransferase [Planctomycetota bacterium]|nr:GNAT family N-acetyltransferase [Planctomycetota bacterium]
MQDNNYSVEDMVIERMTLQELIEIYDYAATEGWNPCKGIAKAVYNIDPKGFWVGKIDGNIVASISIVRYQQHYGFIGLFIVKPPYRGGLIGYRIADYAVDDAKSRGVEILACDGVPQNLHKYEQQGFALDSFITRYQCDVPENMSETNHCVAVNKSDYSKVNNFIQYFEPENRDVFLSGWQNSKNVQGLIIEKNGRVQAYGSLCRTYEGYRIGPLYAYNHDVASHIFNGLMLKAEQGHSIHIDVPDKNKAGNQLVKKWGMEPSWVLGRMYKGGKPDINLSCVFGTWLAEVG